MCSFLPWTKKNCQCNNPFQVGNYIQPLWETIEPVNQGGQVNIYNGAVEAGTTLTGKQFY